MEYSNTVGHRIRLINKEIKVRMDEKKHKEELTAMQRWSLGFLKDHQNQDVFQRDFEDAFFISRATASNMLALMEKKGLIQRVSVEQDARLKKIVLTSHAMHLMKEAEQDIEEMEALIVKGMSKQEQETLMKYLDRIADNLGVDYTRYCGQK